MTKSTGTTSNHPFPSAPTEESLRQFLESLGSDFCILVTQTGLAVRIYALAPPSTPPAILSGTCDFAADAILQGEYHDLNKPPQT